MLPGSCRFTCSQVSALLHVRLHGQQCCEVLQDSIYSLDRAPDREVVHSHDWNRYITPFRAEWDPKDEQERLMVIGR